MATVSLRRTTGERGFVLPLVLSLLALLALVGTRLASASRTEIRIASALRASALVELAADTAVQEIVMRLLRGTWPVSGLAAPVPAVSLRVGTIPVVVLVTDEAVKINPNYASATTLRCLIGLAGVDDLTAKQLADAILEWRQPTPITSGGERKRTLYESSGLNYAPSGRMFDNLDELELVLGMTPRIFASIRPALTVYDVGDIKLDGASPLVTEAVRMARQIEPAAATLGFPSPDRVARIQATATTRGARYTRDAIVRLKARPRADEAPYQFLTWDVGTEASPVGQAVSDDGRRPPPGP